MANYAHIELIGHLGKNVTMTYTEEGMAIAKCSLAVNTGWGDREVTTWYNLTAFGKSAERFNEWTRKGIGVRVSGEPSQNKWKDKEGNERITFEVTLDSFTVLERREPTQDNQQGKQAPQSTPATRDDIPF